MAQPNITELVNSLSRLIALLEATSPEVFSGLSAPNRIASDATGSAPSVLTGTLFDDIIEGGNGADTIDGFAGNDLISGGNGDDRITGNTGNDILIGDNGADTFVFDPSRVGEGDDLIQESLGADTIEIDLADLLVADPNLAALATAGETPTNGTNGVTNGAVDPAMIMLETLDLSTAFSVTESEDQFVVINHPNGSIEVEGLAFGPDTDSFAELGDIFTVTDGRADNSDILMGEDGVEERIAGGDGDDLLFGGTGPDTFVSFPHNGDEGDDVIADFNPEEDTLAFDIANLLAADMDLASAAEGGDDEAVELADLDASASFFVFATADNSVGIALPNGSIELEGVAFGTDTDSFAELAGFIALEDLLEAPTPEDEVIAGFVEVTTPENGEINGIVENGTGTNGGNGSPIPAGLEMSMAMSELDAMAAAQVNATL